MSFHDFTAGARRGAALWRIALAAALVLGLCGSAGALADGAAAASASARAPSAPVAHLSTVERRAIKIVSLEAAGDPSLGLFVSVTFQGEIGRYFGQGGLDKGLLALVLQPTSAGQRLSGVVDQGGGFTAVGFPARVRHGKRVTVKSSSVDDFGSERVQRLPTPGQESVFRNGNQVIFYFPAIGLDQPIGIKVKIFATNPAASKQRAGLQPLTASGWNKIVNTRPSYVLSTAVNPAPLTATQLEAIRSQFANVLTYGFEPALRREKQAQASLKTTIGHYAQNQAVLKVSRSTLTSDLAHSATGVAQLKNKITAIEKTISRVDALIGQSEDPPVSVVQTDSGFSQEMTPQNGLVTSTVAPQGVPVIDVNDRVRYQQFSGLGAAMPDSSAWLIYENLPATERQALIQALFGSPGATNSLGVPPIHLNFLRVPIAAGGAMTDGPPYSYDDNPPGGSDPTLTDFSVAHDLPYILPTIQQALLVNPGLQILANPWSPPAWMKSNDSLDNSNAQGTLLPADYAPFANYIVKFIQAYANYGVPIDAITPQNEPSSGTVATDYPGMTLTEPDEAQFIAQDLEPALRAAGLGTKIYGNDLSWDSAPYADSLAADPAAGPDLSGIAWHCYFGSPVAMSDLHQTSPGLDQIVDECSPEIRSFGTPEFLISSLRNWASTVSVWAAALDPSGGPIQPYNDCNGCRGLVTINEQTQTVAVRTEYYQLGQISAFVSPGATRIGSQDFVTYGVSSSNIETVTSGLDDVAFENPDGSKVLVAYNNSPGPIPFAVDSDGNYFTYTIPSHAMTTFTWG